MSSTVASGSWPNQGSRTAARGDLLARWVAGLGFPLTAAQRRSIDEIRSDLAHGTPMNRLLQGDVGSGKTFVALAAALIAAESGYQTAIMAPTQILAEQHYLNCLRHFAPLGLRIGLRTSARSEESFLPLFAGGDARAQIVIGTHALLFDDRRFRNPRTRRDRRTAQIRGGSARPAHRPRPRSGPPGHDRHADPAHARAHALWRSRCFRPRRDARRARQDHHRSASRCRSRPVDQFPQAAAREGPAGLHRLSAGRGKRRPRRQSRDRRACHVGKTPSRRGRRFAPWPPETRTEGSSDGRVSRRRNPRCLSPPPSSKSASMCRMPTSCSSSMPSASVSPSFTNCAAASAAAPTQVTACSICSDDATDALDRLRILEKTRDGFEIAEADLKLRGPGELLGSKQSGLPTLRLGDLAADAPLVHRARDLAAQLLAEDPTLSLPRKPPFPRPPHCRRSTHRG